MIDSIQSTDPSWFYSSLSQVTGAIVGFVGGFLILRLQTYITDWRQLLVRLEIGQTQWLLTSDTFHFLDQGEQRIPQLSVEKSQRWAELRRGLRERDTATMPIELLLGGLLLIALVGLGIVWPLMALDAPSDTRQVAFLVPWALVILIFGGMMYWRAQVALAELKKFELRGTALAYLEDQELQDEGWLSRDLDELAEHDPVMRELLDIWPSIRDSTDPFDANARMIAVLGNRFGHDPPIHEVGLTKRRTRMLSNRRMRRTPMSQEERDRVSSAAWQTLVAYFKWATKQASN